MISHLEHQELVRKAFASEGYTLLSEYRNSQEKLNFVCPVGHNHSMNWNSFSRGSRCGQCKTPRVTQSSVKEAFEARGYTLLSEYKNQEKLNFICPSGHQYSMSWGHFKKGIRCGYCAKRVISKEQVQQAFEAEEYILLDQFERSDKKMRFICPKGHHHSITWDGFRNGHRCAFCAGKQGNAEKVKKTFADEGYELLNGYINSSTKLQFICPNGHHHSILWSHFKKGVRCAYCMGTIVLHEQVEEAFKAKGYKLLSEYKNHKDKLLVECPYEHIYKISWNNFQQGAGCSMCSVKYRTDEDKEIKKLSSKIRCNIKIYLSLFRKNNKIYDVKLRGKTQLAYELAAKIYAKFGQLPSEHHLDHIVPQSFFNFSNEEEILACWHVENLRFLSGRSNQSRGNRLTIEEVKDFSLKQLEILASASRKPEKFKKHFNHIDAQDTLAFTC